MPPTSRDHEDLTGLASLGVVPLAIPLIGSAALYFAAAGLFGLPERAWAIISVGFAIAWYGFVWYGMRLAAASQAKSTSEAEPVRPLRWAPLRSIGGVVLLAVGTWLLVFGDPTRAVVCMAAGVTLILIAQLWRR